MIKFEFGPGCVIMFVEIGTSLCLELAGDWEQFIFCAALLLNFILSLF